MLILESRVLNEKEIKDSSWALLTGQFKIKDQYLLLNCISSSFSENSEISDLKARYLINLFCWQ